VSRDFSLSHLVRPAREHWAPSPRRPSHEPARWPLAVKVNSYAKALITLYVRPEREDHQLA